MSTQFHSFIHMLFIGVIALFPVVNPIGTALIVNPYLAMLSDREKKNAVTKITLYAFCICMVSLFAGHWILELFGISIPVIQLAGGIMICKMGWESLSAKSSDNSEKNLSAPTTESSKAEVEEKLFYPLTFPITTGAGTISVLFTLSAHSADSNWKTYLINTSAIVVSIITMCVMVFIFYNNTKKLVSKLGSNGQMIANRIFSFLIFCVGLQIALTGFKSIF